MEKEIDISVVVPLYNEEESVIPFYAELKKVLQKLNKSYEVIMVDDGSADKTLQHLERLHKQESALSVISFRKNFGQTAALSAGLDRARGEIIITMDGDLQNDPQDIPKFLAMLRDYDLVNGWRVDRKDPLWRRKLPSAIANKLISAVTGVRLHDYGCTFKAFKRDVAKGIRLYGEMHRFIPAVASWMGVSVGELAVTHHPRKHGKSKYGLSRITKVLLDLITVKFLLSFSTNPIRIFGLMGIASGGAGTLVLFYLAYIKVFLSRDIWGRPLLLLGILLLLIGVQFVAIGLLGEMLVRIYHEGQKKSTYVVKKTL